MGPSHSARAGSVPLKPLHIAMYLDMSQEPPSAKGSHKVHPQRLETHFLMVICKVPWTEEPDGLQSTESQKSWTGLND